LLSQAKFILADTLNPVMLNLTLLDTVPRIVLFCLPMPGSILTDFTEHVHSKQGVA
jgi:hypothetical protein